MKNAVLAANSDALVRQGYDDSPEELAEHSWGLRFTPIVCMLGAIVGLTLRLPAVHFAPPISPERARELLAAGGTLIDVRSPEEFAAGHLPGARNVPLEQVADVLVAEKDRCLLSYCRSGLRAQRAIQALKARGLTGVHNLGGMSRMDEMR